MKQAYEPGQHDVLYCCVLLCISRLMMTAAATRRTLEIIRNAAFVLLIHSGFCCLHFTVEEKRNLHLWMDPPSMMNPPSMMDLRLF